MKASIIEHPEGGYTLEIADESAPPLHVGHYATAVDAARAAQANCCPCDVACNDSAPTPQLGEFIRFVFSA